MSDAGLDRTSKEMVQTGTSAASNVNFKRSDLAENENSTLI
jgi:hypothetical protein